MEKLSKLYKSPRCSKYQRTWAAAERKPSSMPYVGHVLIKVLGLNGLKEIQANSASPARRQSTVRIACASLSDNNVADLRSRDEQSSTEPKQCLAGRFFAATLAKIKSTTRKNIVDETENDAWTLRQRYLARKFFHRWNVITLASKACIENERSAKIVNSKRKRALDVAAWLADCQRFAQAYNFPLHSFAHEFLLKARYREDRENFFISLKLEPPTTTWTRHFKARCSTAQDVSPKFDMNRVHDSVAMNRHWMQDTVVSNMIIYSWDIARLPVVSLVLYLSRIKQWSLCLFKCIILYKYILY